MNNIEEQSITHLKQKDFLSKIEVSEKTERIRSKLFKKYSESKSQYEELNKILNDLADCEFGRFLIYNGSLSGYWTHYVMEGYKGKIFQNKTEEFLLQNAPGTIATRQRFSIFQNLLSELIENNSVCCSIPCGLMAEFLTLNLDKKIKKIKFVGIDIDTSLFGKIKPLFKKYNKSENCFSFIKSNAWDIDIKEKFDIITSNGLNIYEKSDEKVIDLYKKFFVALKPGGSFIGSSCAPSEEWDIEKIKPEDMELQRKIYTIVLEPIWSSPRGYKISESQLESAGFKDIQFYFDTQKIFYTFKAVKPIS